MSYAQGLMDERKRVLRLIEQHYHRMDKDRGYNWRTAMATLAAEVWKGTQDLPLEPEVEPDAVVGQ